MKQSEMFGAAQWVCGGKFPILRGHFTVKNVDKAMLRVLGLGFFHCYVNGKEVTEDAFLPLSTDYEARDNYPTFETLTGHRIYVPEYDITSLLKEGENTIAILFGGGWYTFEDAKFGDAKAIYRIVAETAEGVQEFVSSEEDRMKESFISDYYMPQYENHDYRGFDDACLGDEFDDSNWAKAQPAKPLDTEYEFSDCPADRIVNTLAAVCIGERDGIKLYDCGSNTTGWPVLRVSAAHGEKITLNFSEELLEGGLSLRHQHKQHMTIVADGVERVVRPMLTWYGFRYFTVEGQAEVECVEEVHTDAPVTSSLESDNETLDWIYKTYVHTQLVNMHAGIPSDCPHIERRGYTGDGQLACSAAMTMLDARTFYEKWIKDIGDCQDLITGHVQYTAPYTRCGGGPGGWGCAIVEVPYQYYKHYGDAEPLERLYPQMLRYFDFLEAHSQNLLVTSDKAGQWCLGDWCTPTAVMLPAPFVNNYFYVKSLQRMIEIAKVIGKEKDIQLFRERIEARKAMTHAAYFNTWDGNFIGNCQGANAFAVDMGIGDERTYRNMVEYYRKTKSYDTGIFGTDIVTRVLFEHGDGDVAADLLMSESSISYEEMRRRGATTLWEYWPDTTEDRSHNHPMFGAAAVYLFEYLLGIRQEEGKSGFEEVLIAPVLNTNLNRLKGSRMVPAGLIEVAYAKKETGVEFKIVIPENLKAVFKLGELQLELSAGENTIVVE